MKKRSAQFKQSIITVSTSTQKFKELLADFALENKSFCEKVKVIITPTFIQTCPVTAVI